MAFTAFLLEFALLLRIVYSLGIRYPNTAVNSSETNIPKTSVNSATISPSIDYQGKRVFLIATDNGKMERRVYLPDNFTEDTSATVCLKSFTAYFPPLTFAKVGTRLVFHDKGAPTSFTYFDANTSCSFALAGTISSPSFDSKVEVVTMSDTVWMSSLVSRTGYPLKLHSFTSGSAITTSDLNNLTVMTLPFSTLNNISCLNETVCLSSYESTTIDDGYQNLQGNINIMLNPPGVNFSMSTSALPSKQIHVSYFGRFNGGELFVACTTDGCLITGDEYNLWDLARLCDNNGSIKFVTTVQFDFNNTWVAAVCTNNTVRVFKPVWYNSPASPLFVLVYEKNISQSVFAVTFLKRKPLVADLAVLSVGSSNLTLQFFKAEECTVPNCAACKANIAQCDACQLPHTLSNNNCVRNYTCPASPNVTNCSSCTAANFLNKQTWLCVNSCTGNTAASSTTSACEDCPLNCASCVNNTLNCTSCSSGYYLHVNGTSNGTCASPCMAGYTQANATHCTAATSCGTSSYYNTSSTSCQACNSSLLCDSCTNSTACATCGFDRFLNGHSCDLCSSSCSRCNGSASNCTACNNNTVIIPNCQPISCPNCANCNTTTGTCTTCNDGWYLSNGNCIACDTKCSKCNNAVTCTECKNTSRFLNVSCSEVLCATNCSTCNTGIGICVACLAGSYPTGNYCASCQPNCQTCNSSAGCMTCTTSSYYAPNCVQVTCSANCTNCNYGNGVCSQCSPGSFLASGNCSPCLAGCSNCTSSSVCLTCASNNVSVPNCLPISCGPNCTSCNGSTGKCISCASGYFNSNGNCTKCLEKCTTCNSSTDCQSCSNLSYTAPNCMPANCPANCNECNSTGSCTKCLAGYFLTASTNLCSKCQSKCGTCSNNVTCDTCSTASQWVMPDCEAKLCTDGCDSCNGSTGACMACKSTHYLDGDKCIQCDSSCLTCETKSTRCLSCRGGSLLDNATHVCQYSSALSIVDVKYTAEINTLTVDLSADLVSSDLDPNIFRVAFISTSQDEAIKAIRALGPTSPSESKWKTLPGLESSPEITSARTSGSRLRLVLKNPGNLSGGTAAVHISNLKVLTDKSNPTAHATDFVAAGSYPAVISTGLDQAFAVAAPAVKASLSILTLLMFMMNASQAFVLMKICQTLDFYIYLNVELPANFARFLDMVTSTPIDFVPNFLDTLVDDDMESDKDRFAAFGQTVNIFSNLGAFFTIGCALGVLRVLTWGVGAILKRLGGKANIFGEKVNSVIGLETFYGLFEGYHLDQVLSMIVIITQGYRLRHRLGNKIFITVFVSLFSLFMISMYLFMGYTVRKLSQQESKDTKGHDKKDGKKENKISSISMESTKQVGKAASKQLIPMKFLERFEFWLEDKTENGNIFQRHFNLIQLFKDIVFAALLYALYYKPLVLIILLTLMQASYIYSMIKYPPYKAMKDSKLIFITQIIYIVLDLQFFVLIITSSSQAVFRYYVIGFSMIVTVFCIMSVNMGFIVYQAWQDYKMRRAKRLAQESAKDGGINSQSSPELNEDSKLSAIQNDSNTSMMSNNKRLVKSNAEIKAAKPKAAPKKTFKTSTTIGPKIKVSQAAQPVASEETKIKLKSISNNVSGFKFGKRSVSNDLEKANPKTAKKK